MSPSLEVRRFLCGTKCYGQAQNHARVGPREVFPGGAAPCDSSGVVRRTRRARDGPTPRDSRADLVQLRGGGDRPGRSRAPDHRDDLVGTLVVVERQGSQVSTVGFRKHPPAPGVDLSVRALLRTALQRLEKDAASLPTADACPGSRTPIPRRGRTIAEGTWSSMGTTAPHPGRSRCNRESNDGVASREWFEARRESRCIQVVGDAMSPLLSDGAYVAFARSEESPAELDGKLVVALGEVPPIVRWFQDCGRYALLRAENERRGACPGRPRGPPRVPTLPARALDRHAALDDRFINSPPVTSRVGDRGEADEAAARTTGDASRTRPGPAGVAGVSGPTAWLAPAALPCTSTDTGAPAPDCTPPGTPPTAPRTP